ncbi:septum formation initiator family protein [Chloroflexus sp.]|uniref:septum formation initiator family protein n=1 Tax=Chloroflexus sp. TaxID=1904827 RepID=UPI00298EF036|nr:septum formation initiator family protein [Chloroflexus sp.]MCS6888076.1 septum formation initiator family protein [Chloroflexus sp.]MDW8402908.1 septum formation initiator family protein [Chloroflexus sp.]
MLRGRVRRWLVATFPGSGRTLASLALIAILLIMTGGMAVNLVNQLVIARHLEVELAAANAQVASLQATTQALAQQLEYERSDAAAEAWARDLGLAREGDVVIVPERVPAAAPATAPVVAPSPVPLPSPSPNWQRWWRAFFP